MERRDFISRAGTGLAAAALIGGMPVESTAGVYGPTDKNIGDLITVKLPPLEQPTEKEQVVSSIAMPKNKRIGYAIVGLGNLSLCQILPAFGVSKYAKPVNFVIGDADKAKKIAAQYASFITGQVIHVNGGEIVNG